MAEKKENTLSIDDLEEIFKFARYIYSADPYGYFSPDMSHKNIIDLNNNPQAPTKQKVIDALTNYKDNTDVLSAYSEFMEAFDMIYKRVSYYYANMLAYDLDIICTNAYTSENYKSKEYKEDLRRVYKFLDSFDYKSEFAKVTKELLRRQKYFVWFRDSQGSFSEGELDISDTKGNKTKNFCLQTMPQQYCKITGRWEYGYLYDFDMSYFTRAGISLDSYDPIFRKYWTNVFGEDGKALKYTPTSPLNDRFGNFALWTQTSPDDNAWVFVMDESNIASTPFLSPSIPNLLTDKEIEALQTDKNLISARAILAGEIQLLDKQKSGASTDAMAYNIKTLMKLLQLVKKGLTDNINAVAMPTKEPRLYQFNDSNTDMVSKQNTNTTAQLAGASRIIYSTDKMSETEAKNAVITDYNIMATLYPQYEHFLNFFVNKKTRKYKFKFHLSGCTYPFVRESESEQLISLMDKGVILAPRTYAKLVRMTPMDFDRLLEEGKYSEWTDELTSMLQSVYTQSGKDGKSDSTGGRPKSSDNEISDNGASARDYE